MMFGYTIYRADSERPQVLASRLYEVSALRDEMLRAELERLRERMPESAIESRTWSVPQ